MFDPIFALLFLAALALSVTAIAHWLSPKRHPKSVILAIAAAASLGGFLFYAGPELFVSNEGAAEIYVIAPEAKAEGYVDELAKISRRYGVGADISRTPDNEDSTLHVLEGSGHWLNLWSMNVPLGPNECANSSETRADPGQYVLRISRILPFGTKRSAQELVASISADLRAKGYEVRNAPVPCSPLAKSRVQH